MHYKHQLILIGFVLLQSMPSVRTGESHAHTGTTSVYGRKTIEAATSTWRTGCCNRWLLRRGTGGVRRHRRSQRAQVGSYAEGGAGGVGAARGEQRQRVHGAGLEVQEVQPNL